VSSPEWDEKNVTAVISINNISKKFRGSDGEQIHAIDNINFDIVEGEFISLIGPSGCGKSTLLRMIADLIEPSEGAISINGKSPRQARLDRDYGFVFQSPTLYDWRTVLQNVELPLEIMKYPQTKRRQRAEEMLHLVELGAFVNKYPWQLSGGMQQRVSIARALAFEPTILLMDEPFGALDEMTRERMNNELLRIWTAIPHMTVVFVTHSIAEAVYLSDRVVVLSARPGRLATIIDVDLPRPRGPETRDLDGFFHLTSQVRHALRGGVGDLSKVIE